MGRDGAQNLAGVVTASPSPRYSLVPECETSLADDVFAFAEKVAIPLDDHQRLIIGGMMGVNAEGGWSSPEVAVVEPRQNGKSSCLVLRALWGLLEAGEHHILFSGHMWGATHEQFLFAVDVVRSCPELETRCKVRYSASDLGFTLKDSGARLRFVTRSRQASRGAAADCILFDEAGWLGEATHSALLPTLSARSAAGKCQIVYAGTAVDQTRHPDGLVLANIRRRGIKGEDPRLCYFEWSAEVTDEDDNELPPDRIPDEVATDPDVQRSANPAIPSRITLEHVAWECTALDRRSFSCERLGIGDWPSADGHDSGPINLEVWAALEDPASRITGPVCIGFDVGPSKQSSIAIAGLRDDRNVHVEVVDHRLNTTELVERLVRIVKERDPWLVAVDAFGVAGTIVSQLDAEGVNVHRVTGAEHAEAVGLFMEEVTEETLRHLGSSELLDAVRGAKLRNMGDAHLWSRRHATVDISPLVASSLAVWAARGMPDNSDVHIY